MFNKKYINKTLYVHDTFFSVTTVCEEGLTVQ